MGAITNPYGSIWLVYDPRPQASPGTSAAWAAAAPGAPAGGGDRCHARQREHAGRAGSSCWLPKAPLSSSPESLAESGWRSICVYIYIYIVIIYSGIDIEWYRYLIYAKDQNVEQHFEVGSCGGRYLNIYPAGMAQRPRVLGSWVVSGLVDPAVD